MIFLSEEETPLLEELLLPLSEGEVVCAAGVEVESITVALVVPLMVTSEVIVLTTGVWVVEVVSAAVVLSTVLEVEEGSFVDEVVEDVDVVDGTSEEEEVGVVVCVVVVLGVSEVEEVDDVVVVLAGAEVGSEDELLEVEDSLVRSLRMLEASAL